MRSLMTSLALGASLIAVSTAGVFAQDAVQLRFADSLPATHLFTEKVAVPFMKAVTEATGGQVTFEHFPAQQLGKARDMLSLAVSGVTDIGFVVPIYITDMLPLSGLYDLPGGPFTSCQGVEAFMELATGDGILAQEEYGPAGIRVLMAVVQPPFQVFTAEREIASVDDLAGLKLRTAGGAQEMTANALGIVPVSITAPETSEAMSRGTIDGGILAHVSIAAYGLTDMINYATDGANFGSAALTWSISEKKFQSLSEDVQKTLVEEGRRATMEGCRVIEKGVEEAIEGWRERGVKIVEFGDQDKERMAAMFDEIGQEWAASLDERGKPGSKALAAFRDALEAGQ